MLSLSSVFFVIGKRRVSVADNDHRRSENSAGHCRHKNLKEIESSNSLDPHPADSTLLRRSIQSAILMIWRRPIFHPYKKAKLYAGFAQANDEEQGKNQNARARSSRWGGHFFTIWPARCLFR
jgi:hypothetical protein